LAYKETRRDRPWIVKACWAGIALLLIQSIFGGLTVIYRLPDLVSTTHLGLAFGFLGLATFLAAKTSRAAVATEEPDRFEHDTAAWTGRGKIAVLAWASAGVVFAQSLLGALVRHMDAGMACPDAPLCLGQVVPPLINAPIVTHFSHRVLALVATVVVLTLAVRVLRSNAPSALRRAAGLAAALVLVQVALGFASVLTVLAVAPVSLHTLIAAALLSTLVTVAALAGDRAPHRPSPAPRAATAA
jgi:heme A synthase